MIVPHLSYIVGKAGFMTDFFSPHLLLWNSLGIGMKVLPFVHSLNHSFDSVDIFQWGGLKYLQVFHCGSLFFFTYINNYFIIFIILKFADAFHSLKSRF